MAKKESKKTREQRYAEILSKKGITLDACTVLGFKFPDDIHAHGFHYDLMNGRVEYLLFDSMADGTAIVVIIKDNWNPENPDIIKLVAEKTGGTEYTPNLKAI